MKKQPKQQKPKPDRKKEKEKHFLIGGGGTKSILAGIGAFCGLKDNKSDNWSSIGGISGGSIPAAFIALGLSPIELLRLSVRTDFQKLLLSKRHPWRVIRRYMQQEGPKFPVKALKSSEPLGDYIDEVIPEWPERFWTMAVADNDKIGRCQIVFTKNGAFRYNMDGAVEQISDRPPSVGLAVRASCAIPGVIGAVEYEGMFLFDGMLTWDGGCPVGVLGKHFEAEAEHITAVDIGELNNWFGVIQRRYMNHWLGKAGRGSKDEFKSWVERGVKVINAPHLDSGAIKLDYTKEQKWALIKSAYEAAKSTH